MVGAFPYLFLHKIAICHNLLLNYLHNIIVMHNRKIVVACPISFTCISAVAVVITWSIVWVADIAFRLIRTPKIVC